MVQKILNFVAEFRLKQLTGKHPYTSEKFNEFFGKSESILIIVAEDNLSDANELIKYLLSNDKKVTIFSTVKFFNNLSLMNECGFFEYTFEEINKIGLPNSYLIKRFSREKYDIIINLSSSSNIFVRAIVKLGNTKFRIGSCDNLEKDNFNIQLFNNKNKLSCPQIISMLNLFM